jgi:hypothetical protein
MQVGMAPPYDQWTPRTWPHPSLTFRLKYLVQKNAASLQWTQVGCHAGCKWAPASPTDLWAPKHAAHLSLTSRLKYLVPKKHSGAQ